MRSPPCLRRFGTLGALLPAVFCAVLLRPVGPAAALSHGGPPHSGPVHRESLRFAFPGFVAAGEITYPAWGDGPFPLVLLLHGSSPADMDFTVRDFTGRPLSHIFRDIALYLSARGFAVVRYNKRFVYGPGRVDPRFFDLNLQDLLADARAVLGAARQHPRVDPERVFLYGWSEGSVLAAQIAVADPRVAGLVLQGPVVYSFARTFQAQVERVGLPYLRRFAVDGARIDAEGLEAAFEDGGGLLARRQVLYLLDVAPTGPRVNPAADRDGDGWIDLEGEARPYLIRRFQDSPGVIGAYATGVGLPGLIHVAPALLRPVLILQGENDAITPPADSLALRAALHRWGNPDVTLRLFPGLGHTLGQAASVIDDSFRPIAPQALEAMAAWLAERAAEGGP